MSEPYRVKRFVPSECKDNRVYLIIGARGSGKSFLMFDLLYHLRKQYDYAIAMTSTISTADDLRKVLPPSFVYQDGYDYYKADKFVNVCDKLVKERVIKKGLMILDDCIHDTKCMKTKTQMTLHLNGRHMNSSVISTTQFSLLLGTAIRTNIDYVFALWDPVVANRKRLFEHYYGMFANFKEFDMIFKECTADHGCMVLDRTQGSNEPEDMIKWYRASSPPSFKIGKPSFFKLSQSAQYQQTQKVDKDDADVKKISKKK